MPTLSGTVSRLHRTLSRRPVRVAFVVAAVGLAALAVGAEWPRVRSVLGELSVAALGVSLLAVVGGMLAALVAWRALLSGLGSTLPWPVAGRVLFVGMLGKYVPGAVWPVVAQMELGLDQAVPRHRTAAAFMVHVGFTLASGLAVAAATLPFVMTGWPSVTRWLPLLAAVTLVGCHPRLLNPALSLLLRVARRPPMERPLSLRTALTVLAALVVQWALLGAHLLALAADIGGSAPRLFLICVGGFALAWAMGPLLVVAPAGIGVREAALVALLAPVLGLGGALVLAVGSRVIMTATDLLLALGFGLSGRRPVRSDVPG